MTRILTLFALCAFLWACGGESAEKQEDPAVAAEKAMKEQAEKTAKELDAALDEAEKKEQELDELLKDL
jgi:hypothetical protein